MPAIHTINSIHWMLLRRLLAVWLLVALAVTGIGYYIEVNKFEEGLAAIAASEMRTLSAKVAPDGDKEQQVLAEETKDFIRKHYRLVGTPIRFEFRDGDNPFAGRANPLTERQRRKRQRLIRHIKRH